MLISGHVCEIGIQTPLSTFHSEMRSKLVRTVGTWGSLLLIALQLSLQLTIQFPALSSEDFGVKTNNLCLFKPVSQMTLRLCQIKGTQS